MKKDNKKQIAVLLPVYNKDKVEYLNLSVDSILQQTYRYIKLFIGVDGFVGEDLKTCLNKYNQHDNVQVIYYEENRGLACVLNDMLKLCFAEGFEYIARMDADDISIVDRLEKEMLFLDAHHNIDVVGGLSIVIDEKGLPKGVMSSKPEWPEDCRKRFAYHNPLSHPAVLFKKSFFDKAGFYRPEYRTNQDTLRWFDGLRNGVMMANIQEPVIYFRSTSDMLTKRRGGFSKAKKQFSDRLMINKELKYGFKANIYAFAIFIMMISPAWIRKIAYRVLKK